MRYGEKTHRSAFLLPEIDVVLWHVEGKRLPRFGKRLVIDFFQRLLYNKGVQSIKNVSEFF